MKALTSLAPLFVFFTEVVPVAVRERVLWAIADPDAALISGAWFNASEDEGDDEVRICPLACAAIAALNIPAAVLLGPPSNLPGWVLRSMREKKYLRTPSPGFKGNPPSHAARAAFALGVRTRDVQAATRLWDSASAEERELFLSQIRAHVVDLDQQRSHQAIELPATTANVPVELLVIAMSISSAPSVPSRAAL